ncbi:MAG: pitrilysin family protein [Clostridia bacterium]
MENCIYTFASGLRLAHKKLMSVRSVGISILTAAGCGNETAENNGISHFIEHMLFKGTKTRSSFNIVEEIDGIGAQVNAYTAKQSTCFYTLSVDNQAEKCAEILSDLLFNSTFDEGEMEKEKGVVLEEISMSQDEYSDLCLDMSAEAYFGKNPLGMEILGTRKNVKNFSRQQIIDYIAENYCAKDTVISIVGNISFDEAKRLVETYFEGNFNINKTRKWEDEICKTHPKYVKKIKDIEQANIALTMPSIEFSSKLDMALMLVNNIVGGGMSSRMFQEIREKQGLAYNVFSYPSYYVNNGIMTLYIGTNTDSVEKALDSTATLIKDIRKNGLSQKEFARGKQQLIGTYVLGQESTSVLMRLYAKSALYNNEYFDFDKKIKQIESLSYCEVQEAIDKSFDISKASISYIGKKLDSNLLEIINK